jgi:hypothetical protein
MKPLIKCIFSTLIFARTAMIFVWFIFLLDPKTFWICKGANVAVTRQ